MNSNQPRTTGTGGAGGLAVLGTLLIAARFLVPGIPLTVNGTRVTIGQAHDLCASMLGTFAQAVSSTAATDCQHITAVYDVLNVCTAAGVACLAGAAWLLARARRSS